jgi:tetratricopeptide (TPR) repeat protein
MQRPPDLEWNRSAVQTPLRIADDGVTLSWPPGEGGAKPPPWLRAEATAQLSNGRFRWEFAVEVLGERQIGVGILIAPVDWGFFGYLGSGRNAFAYDPFLGAIVTETVAIHDDLPAFRAAGAGVVAVELDLVERDSCTFIVDGQPTPPVPVPPGATVIPAVSLLAPGQKVRLRGFEVHRVAASNERERTERFALASKAVRERIVAHSPAGRSAARAEAEVQRLVECEEQLRARPDDLVLLTRRAELMVRLGIDRALVAEALQQITAMNPTDWLSWRRLAGVLAQLDRYEEQLPCWDRLIAGLPASARSLEADKQGWIPGTEHCASPGRGDAYYLAMRAQCLARLGRQAESLSVWHEAIARDPNNAWYLADMAGDLSAQGSLEAAVRVYDRVVALSPTYWAAAHKRCLCLARLGRLDESLAGLQPLQRRDDFGANALAAYLIYKRDGADAAGAALHALVSANPRFHPLTAELRRTRDLVDAGYAALTESVFEQYAHLRPPQDPA